MVKRRSSHSRLVVDSVTSDAGGVLDDSFATTDDAVDQSRLTDVRATDDSENRKRRQEDDRVGVFGDGVENVEVFLIELVVLQDRQEVKRRAGPHPLRRANSGGRRWRCPTSPKSSVSSSAIAESLRFVSGLSASRTSATTAATVWSKSRSVESSVVTPSAAFRKSTTFESWASRELSCRAVDSADSPVSSAERLPILTCSDAVSSIRTCASGATTVVMSRPSTMIPGFSLDGDDATEQLDHERAHLGDPRNTAHGGSSRRAPGCRRSRRLSSTRTK